mmetsp:Transcript_104467/g.239354  ORF Transcript_104467/g.239354 Transcript_104467/m.239354 type:complete len:464 (-) Transcript_104467:73-1464(-)
MGEQLHDVLDRVGLTLSHFLTLLICGGIFLSDGSEMLAVSAMVKSLAAEFPDMGPTQQGLLVSTVFVGVLLGSACSGAAGDRFGRKPVIVFAYGFLGVFGCLCALAPSYQVMICLRFCVGFAFGIGVPAAVTMVVECMPTKYRDNSNNVINAGFPAGELYAGLGCMVLMPQLQEQGQWRSMCLWSSIPALVIFPFAIWLQHESPRFLLVNNRREELTELIKSWRPEEKDLQLDAPRDLESPAGVKERFARIFAPDMLASTVCLSYCCLVANFTFYGQSYMAAQAFAEIAKPSDTLSPAAELTISSTFELPGALISILLVSYAPWGFKASLRGFLYLNAFLALALITLDFNLFSWYVPATYLIRMSSQGMFLFVYVVVGTSFPTVVRNTGIGFCMAIGRLGSVIAPITFEAMTTEEHHEVFIVATATLALAGAFMVGWLPQDMKGVPLGEGSTALPPDATKATK